MRSTIVWSLNSGIARISARATWPSFTVTFMSGIGFGERQAQRAKVDLDIGAGAVGELVGQRPVAGAHDQRGVGCDQDRRRR